MMTKWDTIQADVADAYVWMDEELAIEKINNDFQSIFGDNLISLDELLDEEELEEDYE
jgi:hypothetical protein